MAPPVVEGIIDAIQSGLGSWDPENATEIRDVLESLSEIPGAMRDALQSLGDKLTSESDVDPAVGEALNEAASAFDGTVDGLDEAYTTLRDAHEEQYERIENKPTGGEKWDISKNPDA